MVEGASHGVCKRFLPFAVLSENRAEPFTPDVEAAAVFALAEMERSKGGGLIARQPEETTAFIAKLGCPLWLFPWSGMTLVFDGLSRTSYTVPYATVPEVNAFVDNLKRNSRTRETHLAFISDEKDPFEGYASEKGLLMNGLIREPEFLTELDSYCREAAKISQEDSKIDVLPPILDEVAVSSEIHELENLRLSLQTSEENLYECIKLLNSVKEQYTRELQSKAKDVEQEFAIKLKEEEKNVAPIIRQLEDLYNFQIKSMAKSYEKQQLPVQQEKAKLEKTREQALARIEKYKQEAKTLADKGHSAAEQKWKEKADSTRKELSEIENQLKETEKDLKDLEEQRSVETFKLKEELETKVRETRKGLLELEASRDAKIQINNQEIEKLERLTKLKIDQISKTTKLMEANITQFMTLGIKQEPMLEESVLCYVPFYVACFSAESKKRYMILPPSVVSTVGVFTMLKGALGMAKMKSLLVPRFKNITDLVDSLQAFAQQNAAFEAELNELGAKNNMLSVAEVRDEIKKGLDSLKSEGWLSDKEFDAIVQRIG
jgi:hypothetical protein